MASPDAVSGAREAIRLARRVLQAWGTGEPPTPKERVVVPDNGARYMTDEESGLGYDTIVVPNPAGDGWDVVKTLEHLTKKPRR